MIDICIRVNCSNCPGGMINMYVRGPEILRRGEIVIYMYFSWGKCPEAQVLSCRYAYSINITTDHPMLPHRTQTLCGKYMIMKYKLPFSVLFTVCQEAGVDCRTVWDDTSNCWTSSPGKQSYGGRGMFLGL